MVRVRPEGESALRISGSGPASPRGTGPEGFATARFAAARFGRGGVYGPQWRLIGWLQEKPTDYRSAYHHGLAVKGADAFARNLFPMGLRVTESG